MQNDIIESHITREPYEADFMNFMERVVKPGWHCVDVGACKGDYTLLLARCVGPTGKVFSFDIFPPNIERLGAVIQKCNLGPQIELNLRAVTDGAAERVQVHPGRNNSDFEWNITGRDVNGVDTPPLFDVPATSLDAYFADKAPPQVVKIDVEGAGAGVLRGMTQLSKKNGPIVFFEVHGDAEWQAVLEFCKDRYAIWDPEHDSELQQRNCKPIFHSILVPKF